MFKLSTCSLETSKSANKQIGGNQGSTTKQLQPKRAILENRRAREARND